MPNEKAHYTRPVKKIFHLARIHPNHNKLSITYGHKIMYKKTTHVEHLNLTRMNVLTDKLKILHSHRLKNVNYVFFSHKIMPAHCTKQKSKTTVVQLSLL